ncbi:MAG: S9 family peptidase, partial [Gemmatimonadota bacterium]|nr:S9 family peptidase [Gemmatimonadota bacterium]
MRRLALLLVIAAALPLAAQEPYRTPPEIVRRILDAPAPPVVSASPDGSVVLMAERQARPTIADLAQPMLRIAGRRINPATNGTFATSRGYVGLTLRDPTGGGEFRIGVPDDADVGDLQWSPDGRQIAFTNTRPG